jgi:hypothetical protein
VSAPLSADGLSKARHNFLIVAGGSVWWTFRDFSGAHWTGLPPLDFALGWILILFLFWACYMVNHWIARSNNDYSGSKLLRWTAAGMLLVALLPLPGWYYTILRIVVIAAAVWPLALDWDTETGWKYVLAGLILLFNPIFSFGLPRVIWMVIDPTAALLLVWSTAKIGVAPRPSTVSGSASAA